MYGLHTRTIKLRVCEEKRYIYFFSFSIPSLFWGLFCDGTGLVWHYVIRFLIGISVSCKDVFCPNRVMLLIFGDVTQMNTTCHLNKSNLMRIIVCAQRIRLYIYNTWYTPTHTCIYGIYNTFFLNTAGAYYVWRPRWSALFLFSYIIPEAIAVVNCT